MSRQGGSYFRTAHLGRGLAIGDLDNKGRPDLVISHLNEPVAVLQNRADAGHHWLGIELAGKNHRDVAGARVVVETGGRRLTRFAKGGGSFLSSGDRRHLFGLGNAEAVDRVTVYWPPYEGQPMTTHLWGGERLKLNRYWRLVEDQVSPQEPHADKEADR
jgi:hypothetical protein